MAMEAPPRWAVWSAGLLLVAGILHLTALPSHASQARGLGLFFLALGAAQVLWACTTLFRSTHRSARIGLALLAVAPAALWLATRVLRAPWSASPEPIDVIGLGTTLLEVSAAAVLAAGRAGLHAEDGADPSLARRAAVVFIAVGLAFGAVAYAGGLAAEAAVPWLGEAEDHHDEPGPMDMPDEGSPPPPHAD